MTPFHARTMINNAPMWLLRHQYRPWGARMTKKPDPPTGGYHCGNSRGYTPRSVVGFHCEDRNVYMLGEVACTMCCAPVRRMYGLFREGLWYHSHCWDKLNLPLNDPYEKVGPDLDKLPQHYIDTAQGPVAWEPPGTDSTRYISRKERRARYHREGERMNIDPGNLDTTQYRYWVGHLLTTSPFAMCRACETSVYSKTEMIAHKDDRKFWIGDSCCTVLLNRAYKNLLNKGNCIVCGSNTMGARWGIPMCSAACIQKWKFQTGRSSRLIMELLNAKREAVDSYRARLRAMAPEGKLVITDGGTA